MPPKRVRGDPSTLLKPPRGLCLRLPGGAGGRPLASRARPFVVVSVANHRQEQDYPANASVRPHIEPGAAGCGVLDPLTPIPLPRPYPSSHCRERQNRVMLHASPALAKFVACNRG